MWEKEEEEFPDWIREVKKEHSLFTFSLILIKIENTYALLQESQYSLWEHSQNREYR